MGHVLDCTGYEMAVRDIESAEGYYLYNSEGKRYMDFEAGVWCISIGHSNPHINAAVKQQLDKIMHFGFRYTGKIVEDAAADVLSTLPFEGKCVFLSSGSEAVELSVKMAKTLSKGKKLLTFKESYLSAYGAAGNKAESEWISFDASVCRKCPYNYSCDKCSFLDEISFVEVGAFIFEPGNSGGLVLLPPKALIAEIVKRIKEQDGLIVVDEVTTGVGRTGKWYGFENFGLKPDIVAIGKGIGNGYPVSIVAVEERTAASIERENLRHSQSHQNDALGCTVISEVISIIERDGLIKKSCENGSYFIGRLKELKGKSKEIREVRGIGLMIAVEFEPEAADVLNSLNEHLLYNGFVVGYKPAFNLIRFYPSLTVSREDIDALVNCMEEFLRGNDI